MARSDIRKSFIPFVVIAVGALIAAHLAIANFPKSQFWSGAAVAVFLLGILVVAALRNAGSWAAPRSRLLSRLPIAIFGTVFFVVGTLVSWQFDFRDRHFFDTGWVVIVFNIWRLFVLGFLLLIFRGFGYPLRRYFERSRSVPLTQGVFEAAIFDSTIGAALLIILMFVAGLLGLYYRVAALPVAAVGCGIGLYVGAADYTKAIASADPLNPYSIVAQRGLVSVLVPIVISLIGLTALARIGAEYDASHYLPYYEEVIANHGTAINDYWYHFWISKGAGLQFFAVMLGDVFSASLASFALLILSGCWIFLFIRRVMPEDRSLAFAAVLVFLTPFLYTFPYQQKEHFVVMGLLMATLWVVAWMCQPRSDTLRPGLIVVTLIASAAVICSAPAAGVLGLWFVLLALVLFADLWRQGRTGANCAMAFIPAATVAGIVVAILVINQKWVGMAEATPFKLFFKYADQHRLSRYISPYLVLFLEEASSASTGRVTWESLIHPDFTKIWGLLHFSVLPFGKTAVLGTLCVGASSMWFRSVRQRLGWPAFCLGAFLFVAGLISLLVSQPASLYRFYIFSLPVAVATLAMCIVAVVRLVSFRWDSVVSVATPVIATILGIYVASVNIGKFAEAVDIKDLDTQLQFIVGNRSLAKAIGIMPKCTKMYNSFSSAAGSSHASGASVRIWTLTFLLPVGCYVLPQPRVLMEMSASFGPHWHRIVFGSEKEARHELERLGIRYFYVDLADFKPGRRYSDSTSLMGCLAYSRLFAPAVIPKYFRVVWRDEDAYLLVLANGAQGGTPVPNDFIRRWPGKRNKVQYGLGQMEQICDRVGGYYRQHGENWPVNIDPTLPKLKGWQ